MLIKFVMLVSPIPFSMALSMHTTRAGLDTKGSSIESWFSETRHKIRDKFAEKTQDEAPWNPLDVHDSYGKTATDPSHLEPCPSNRDDHGDPSWVEAGWNPNWDDPADPISTPTGPWHAATSDHPEYVAGDAAGGYRSHLHKFKDEDGSWILVFVGLITLIVIASLCAASLRTVYRLRGWGKTLGLNAILLALGVVPGVIHALSILCTTRWPRDGDLEATGVDEDNVSRHPNDDEDRKSNVEVEKWPMPNGDMSNDSSHSQFHPQVVRGGHPSGVPRRSLLANLKKEVRWDLSAADEEGSWVVGDDDSSPPVTRSPGQQAQGTWASMPGPRLPEKCRLQRNSM